MRKTPPGFRFTRDYDRDIGKCVSCWRHKSWPKGKYRRVSLPTWEGGDEQAHRAAWRWFYKHCAAEYLRNYSVTSVKIT